MAGGSKTAVFAAIGANSAVAIAKLAGFGLTGSGTLLAEGIHSVADVGNQTLLAVGMRRAAQPPDDQHPIGYGRAAFVWALISAVGIFFLGCGVTVAHGVQTLLGGHHGGAGHDAGGIIAMGILVFSLVVEGASLWVAFRVSRQHAAERGVGVWEHIRTSDDPFELAVLMEDSAAVVGVLLALAATVLTRVTHQTFWDPIGSIAIGLLLGAVAIALIQLNRRLLIGKAIHPVEQARLTEILNADDAVEAVTMSTSVVAGTDAYAIRAELDLDGRVLARRVLRDTDLATLHASIATPQALGHYLESFAEDITHEVGNEVDDLEARIREAIPRATRIDLEID